MVSWQERLAHARELFFFFVESGRGSYARNHRSVLVGDSLQPCAVDPELTEGQGDRDGQEDELRSCAGHRLRELGRNHNHIPDVWAVDDLHDGVGDYGILLGYAGDESGKTKVRSLMLWVDVGGETAILHEMKLGPVVTTLRTSGFGVESVECKNLSSQCGASEAKTRSAPCGVMSTGYERSDPRCQQQRWKPGRGCKRRSQQDHRS